MDKKAKKAIINRLIWDIWEFMKKYGFEKLTNTQWEEQHRDAIALEKKYKGIGKPYEMLFRGMYDAVRSFYEEIGKNEGAHE